MSYVISSFQLVSCMNVRNQLLYFAKFCALLTPKKANKNPKTKNFARCLNHFRLLTMFELTGRLVQYESVPWKQPQEMIKK